MVKRGQGVVVHQALLISRDEFQLCAFASGWHSGDQEMKLSRMLLEVVIFRGMSMPVSPSLKRSRARIRVGYRS